MKYNDNEEVCVANALFIILFLVLIVTFFQPESKENITIYINPTVNISYIFRSKYSVTDNKHNSTEDVYYLFEVIDFDDSYSGNISDNLREEINKLEWKDGYQFFPTEEQKKNKQCQFTCLIKQNNGEKTRYTTDNTNSLIKAIEKEKMKNEK